MQPGSDNAVGGGDDTPQQPAVAQQAAQTANRRGVSFSLSPAEATDRGDRPHSRQASLLCSELGSQHEAPQIHPQQRLLSPLFADNILSAHDRPPQRAPDSDSATETRTVAYNPAEDSRHIRQTGYSLRESRANIEADLANGALLIYPKKIDNLRRFRILFVGLLLFISSSTQGVHSLFGTLYLQVLFTYDVRKMAIVYLCGQAFGLFVFPFGALYDWFGPRVVVACASAIAALGHLLFALTFSGHIAPTVTNCAVFYALMCWGCYAIDVAVLPSVLSHMPRDRGQPTGLLQTFSGLGSSLISCLFRGFFSNNFANLMWFMFALTVVVGVAGTWYLEDAPYVVNRWQQRSITPREQLRRYLIRNRYMSQLVPRRRYVLLSLVLIMLNFYLTIQAVVVAYRAADMTDGKRRGIAIGSIVIVLFLLVLVVPLDSIDGPTEQDKQVIEAARRNEERIHEMHAEEVKGHVADESVSRTHEEGVSAVNPLRSQPSVGPVEAEKSANNHNVSKSATRGEQQQRTPDEDDAVVVVDAGASMSGTARQRSRRRASVSASSPRHDDGGVLTQHVGLPLYRPAVADRSLISVNLADIDNVMPFHSHSSSSGGAATTTTRSARTPPAAGGRSGFSPFAQPAAAAADADAVPPSMEAEQSLSYTARVDGRGNVVVAGAGAVAPAAPRLSYAHPRVEVITLCGEVFVAPVHKTTFMESLTYIDLWMIAYTTMCVWGIGMTMTGNWNIYVMLLARYGGMEQKHYVLFAAMAGVSTAGGRVFLGMYERVLQILRERTGAAVVPTVIYPVTSVGLFLGTVLWLALPGDKVLVLAYLIGPSFYGISTSITPYVLGTIFDRDLGMHYGFCYFAGAIGFVLCFWCSWYLTYREETSLTPRGYMCVGERRCMNRAVGIYVALSFSSIVSAFIVHYRYSKLVKGELVQKRVIVPHLMRVFRCCACRGGSRNSDADDNDDAAATTLQTSDATVAAARPGNAIPSESS